MQASLLFPPQRQRIERNPLDFAAILLVLLFLVLLGATAAWHFWYAQRIYNGVSVAGAPLGGVTRSTALNILQQRFQTIPLSPLSLSHQGQRWPLRMEQVQVRADLLAAVNQAYLVGRRGNFADRLSQQLLIALHGHAITPPLTFSEDQVRQAVEQIAREVNTPGRPASQIGGVDIPSIPAVEVDVAATTQAVLAALQTSLFQETLSVPLLLFSSVDAPATGAAPPVNQLSVIHRTPLLVRNDARRLDFAIDPATLETLVSATEPRQVNQAALQALVAEWAQQIELPAHDARLRFNAATGGLTIIQPSVPGRKLDVVATVASIADSLMANRPRAALVVMDVAPAVDGQRIAELGIRELVVSATSYFRGSSAARVRNIEAAATHFDGVVIPPGENFSFNQIVESVSSANNFEDSLVIWGDQTVVGVGGGVCQVSTTLFRAAYAGGFPIVERYNHGYVVDWYGEPGLDATIYTPSVDFKFRNDTAAYLLIEPVVDSANGVITFNFYGTKPDRVVTIGAPVKSEVKAAEPPLYTVDEALSAGQKKQVEWEKPGMTVTVERTIVENGATRTDTLKSHYQPWRAVYLVGSGADLPVTPSSVITSTVSGQ
jgi:vancomycin resistance protein YoaR